MKSTLLTALLFISLFSSGRTVDDILEAKEQKKQFYRLRTGVEQVMVIGMSFANFDVITEADKKELKKADIYKIDLVYTDFPKGADLTELNRNRIKKALSLRADLVENESIQWQVIRQMGCNNEAEAKVLFHGLVIYYRGEQGDEIKARDLSYINTYLPESLDEKTAKRLRKETQDSTLFKVFERNKDWSNMTVVTDLTGSMSPYIFQLMVWYQLTLEEKKIKNVVLFNDGDMKTTAEKIIGETGGIYCFSPKEYNEFREKVILVTSKGSGGDGPENDIEALIRAQKEYPNVKEFILIADNLAPIKDFVLADQIKKPVHVILCGTNFGINVDYLNLARMTSGSVHTMNQDLEELYKMSEGKTFTINRSMFKIVDGKIIPLTKG
ncbi:MAG: hypothetical protein N4A41_05730 [Crocinitomicaceae bacterium]|jgi:hypothetical protein|nr:hypothetical protein [Crocinitomicaceae bacterium]